MISVVFEWIQHTNLGLGRWHVTRTYTQNTRTAAIFIYWGLGILIRLDLSYHILFILDLTRENPGALHALFMLFISAQFTHFAGNLQ